MQHPSQHFFGYGSLVNVSTHHTPWSTQATTLKGWRRAWSNRTSVASLGTVVSLTAYPCQGCQIDGLLAVVPSQADWDVLAVREAGYDRIQLQADVFTPNASSNGDYYVYQTQPQNRGAAVDGHVILQSYIDAVLQGYLHVFGENGVQRFIDTTDGWDGEIHNDRDKPKYPRSVVLTDDERKFIDEVLEPYR